MTLGDKLKLLRSKKGMTQETFAEMLSVSRSAIAKWESNNGIPDISNLKQISQGLNISLDELLDDKICIDESEHKGGCFLSEYAGYCCDIDLVGWNDGVYSLLICGEDKDFLFYQKTEKNKTVYGVLGKKYIASVRKHSKSDRLNGQININRQGH